MAQLTDDCFAFSGPLLRLDEMERLIGERIAPVVEIERVPLRGARGRVTADELDTMMKNGQAVVIDVRNQASYDMGHIPGSKLIPAGEILNHVNELPRDKMIVTYCS